MLPQLPTDPAELPAGIAYVLAGLNGRQIALPLTALVEVVDLPEVAVLPLAPEWLSGVTNLRGRVVPVINLSRLLNWPVVTLGRRALVLRDGRFRMALPVESVQAVRWLTRDELPTTATGPIELEQTIDGRPTWILNAEAVLAQVRRGDQAVMAGR